MSNIDEKYMIAMGVVLEEVSPAYFNKSEIQETIYEDIDELRLKKLINTIKESVEETEGISDIHEERKIALEKIKTFSDEDFEEFKQDLKSTIIYIKEESEE